MYIRQIVEEIGYCDSTYLFYPFVSYPSTMKSFLRILRSSHDDLPSSARDLRSTTQGKSQGVSNRSDISSQEHHHVPIEDSLTVIELFQSQGCNSCPPTNANLIEMTSLPASRLSNAIFLTYHVTYWDYLGWRDTFGNSAFDTRQRDYVKGLGLRNAFTPQVVVNGRASGVGNTKNGLEKVLRDGEAGRVPSVKIDINHDNSNLDETVITVSTQDSAASNNDLDIFVVRYDPSSLNEDIKSGENKGRVLPHRNVVRSVERVRHVRLGQNLVFAIDKQNDGLEAVLLVQESIGGPVIGAAKV